MIWRCSAWKYTLEVNGVFSVGIRLLWRRHCFIRSIVFWRSKECNIIVSSVIQTNQQTNPIISRHRSSIVFCNSRWESVPKRQESRESTEPDMVPPSVRLSERWRSPSTLPTVASSAVRIRSRELVPESGTAVLAERPWLVEHTLWAQPVGSLSAVPLDVYEDWQLNKLKLKCQMKWKERIFLLGDNFSFMWADSEKVFTDVDEWWTERRTMILGTVWLILLYAGTNSDCLEFVFHIFIV